MENECEYRKKVMFPAVMNKPEEPPLGLIAIDSLYSPVKKSFLYREHR